MPALPSPRLSRPPSRSLVHRVARDIRDAAGAAAISLGVFGLPVVLAAMQVELPPLELQIQPESERAASFVMLMPPPLADDLADTDEARGDAGEAPPAEPVQEPAEQPADEPADEPALADDLPDDAPADDPADDAPAEDASAEDAPEALADAVPPTPELPDPALKLPDERIVVKTDGPLQGQPRFVALASTPERLARLEAARSKARSSGERKARGRKCQDASGAIVATKAGQYEVERELIDMYVKDLKLAQTLARVGWHRDEDGKIDGFKIWRISCGTVLHEAGFRNGDVVHTVNGKKVRTVIGAIAAYRKLKRKDHLRVDVTGRDGSRRMMRYEVIEG